MANALVLAHSDEFEVLQRTARMLAVSGYFDAKGDTPHAIAQLATKILAGRELGFGPFAAVNGIHIIQGKPTVGANLMASAVKSSGRYDYRVVTMSDDGCTIAFFQLVADGKMEKLGESSFSRQDAEAADLLKNPMWKKYPKNMAFARALSNGVRFYCPDVFNGAAFYVPEELGADVDGDGNVVEVQGRRVDAETGEITQLAPAAPASLDADVDLWKPDAPQLHETAEAAVRRRKLHAMGHELYGVTWDAKRRELVSIITKGRTQSSSDLTEAEYDKLIAGMEAKRNGAAQPVAAK